MKSVSLNDDWRQRAYETADKLEQYKDALDVARIALDVIVHCGYVGDQWVDVAVKAQKDILSRLGERK